VISAVVVNHNGERWLDRCLSSLDASSVFDLQIVLVDNASTDGSLAMVRRRFPHVHLLCMGHNVGFAVANNLGAACADGDELLFLNNDAWLQDGALERLRARLESSPEAAVVAPRLLSPEGRPRFGWSPDRGIIGEVVQRLRNPFEGRRWNHGPVERLLRVAFGEGWYSGACLLIRRRAFDQVSGFDPAFFLYFEDADLCLRLRGAGWRLVQEPSSVVIHVGGRGTEDEAIELHCRQSQLYYYSKHRPRWEEELLWKHLVRIHQEGAVARWLGHGEQSRPQPPDVRRAVEEIVAGGRLPRSTSRRLSRCLDELRRNGGWREVTGD
jgi:GT2 family glycosyltransferase